MNTEIENNELYQKSYIEKLQITYILGIFFGIISTVVLFFTSHETISDNAKNELKRYLNFEICIAIITILLNFIPLLGQLACLALWILNLMVSINANKAVASNSIPQYPFTYNFIN